jgi:hypothetical protein
MRVCALASSVVSFESLLCVHVQINAIYNKVGAHRVTKVLRCFSILFKPSSNFSIEVAKLILK